MTLKYNDLVIEHFRNPRNAGEMDDPDVTATEGSLACGDMMTIFLKIDGSTIADIKFQSYGCAANIATGSMLTEIVKGKTLEEAKGLSWNEIVEGLGGLPPVKHHCSSLAVDTLRKAIDNAEKKARGEPIDEEPVVDDQCEPREGCNCHGPANKRGE